MAGTSGIPRAKKEEFNVFENFTQEELDQIFGYSETMRFAGGDIVFEQGTAEKSIYIVLEGAFETLIRGPKGKRIQLAEIKKGSVFGEMSFFDGLPRSASVRALSASRVMRISTEGLEKLADRFPRLAIKVVKEVVKVLSLRLREADRYMAAVKAKEA